MLSWFLAALIVVHGLIHLMGPAKAFGWAELPDLRLSVSPTAGALWLTAALLFLTAAGLLIVAPPFPARPWWWAAALPAIVLSQVLIGRAWTAAKFGTIANVVILLPAIIAAASALPSGFRATYARETAAALAALPDAPTPAVTAADLEALPPPVRRYLAFAGAVGRPRVRSFHVRFEGAIRQSATDPWMRGTIDQRSTVAPFSRVFLMHATRAGMPMEALHVFRGPHAWFTVRIASLVRAIDARGPEMDQAETVTILNDLCLLAPAALLDAPISWSDVTDRQTRASFTHEGRTVSALLTFADDGSLVNFESDDRYRTDGITHERARWSTPIERWAVVDGTLVPVTAEARWTTAADDFAYARFTIVQIAHNRRGT